jgi:hypothetical protein
VGVFFRIMASSDEARIVADRSLEAAKACEGHLEEIGSASGFMSTDTRVSRYEADGWNGVIAVTTGRRGDEVAPQRFPFTDVAVIAARGVMVAEIDWTTKGRDRTPVDPAWEEEGRKAVAKLLRLAGGDPALGPPSKPDADSTTQIATANLPAPELYAPGIYEGLNLDNFAATSCSLGVPRDYNDFPAEMAFVSRSLAGNDAYVTEMVAVLPDEKAARKHQVARADHVRFSGERMPMDCFSYGHLPHLPLEAASTAPFLEQPLEIGRWTGSIGSSAARLRGAPKDATLPNSMAWIGAVVSDGRKVAHLTLFTKASEDLNATLAEKRILVEDVLRGMTLSKGESTAP